MYRDMSDAPAGSSVGPATVSGRPVATARAIDDRIDAIRSGAPRVASRETSCKTSCKCRPTRSSGLRPMRAAR